MIRRTILPAKSIYLRLAKVALCNAKDCDTNNPAPEIKEYLQLPLYRGRSILSGFDPEHKHNPFHKFIRKIHQKKIISHRFKKNRERVYDSLHTDLSLLNSIHTKYVTGQLCHKLIMTHPFIIPRSIFYLPLTSHIFQFRRWEYNSNLNKLRKHNMGHEDNVQRGNKFYTKSEYIGNYSDYLKHKQDLKSHYEQEIGKQKMINTLIINHVHQITNIPVSKLKHLLLTTAFLRCHRQLDDKTQPHQFIRPLTIERCKHFIHSELIILKNAHI